MSLCFERTEQGVYNWRYYEVVLKKAIEIPRVSTGEVEVEELEKKIVFIDWSHAGAGMEMMAVAILTKKRSGVSWRTWPDWKAPRKGKGWHDCSRQSTGRTWLWKGTVRVLPI